MIYYFNYMVALARIHGGRSKAAVVELGTMSAARWGRGSVLSTQETHRASPLPCEDDSSSLHALLKHCFAGGWVKSSKYIFVFQSDHTKFSLGFMVMLAALSSD